MGLGNLIYMFVAYREVLTLMAGELVVSSRLVGAKYGVCSFKRVEAEI